MGEVVPEYSKNIRMKFIECVVADTLRFISSLFLTVLIKNPCKKCLVRACCSEICEKKEYYLTFCGMGDSIKFQRFCALSIILTTSGFFIWIIFGLFLS